MFGSGVSVPGSGENLSLVKRVSNRKLKMELGRQFKYPNFRKGYSAEILPA